MAMLYLSDLEWGITFSLPLLHLVPGVSPLSFKFSPIRFDCDFCFLVGFCLSVFVVWCRGLNLESAYAEHALNTKLLLWLWVVICLTKLTWLHEERRCEFLFPLNGKGMVLWTHLESWSFSLWDGVLGIWGWPVAVEQDLDLLILLSLPPRCCDYKYVNTKPILCGLESKPWALYILDKHILS